MGIRPSDAIFPASIVACTFHPVSFKMHASPLFKNSMLAAQIRALIQTDLSQTDALIRNSLHSEVELIQQIGEYVFQSGGKRSRLILTLLASKACGLEGDASHILGAILEMIHTATLLHDDVIDASEMRRGRKTANTIYGNTATILSGDFLYSRSFELMVKLNSIPVLQELAQASNKIAEGEMLQLQNCHRVDLKEADYLKVVNYKTATLFEAAAKIPALIAGISRAVYEALAQYGNHLGIAFQVQDDLLDYMSVAASMGKNPGDDLAEGKMTLPLMFAQEAASHAERKVIHHAVVHGDVSALPQIVDIIHKTGSIERVQNYARHLIDEAKHALAILPQNAYVKALCDFADLAIERSA